MTILAAGQGLRKIANTGMQSVAALEADEIRQAEALEAAKEGQKMQMYSTGAGIGASYGVKNALAQKAAFTPAPVVESIGTYGAGAEAVLAGEAVVGEAVATGATQAAAEGATAAVVEGAVAEGATAAVVEGTTAVVAEGAATTVAAGTGGTLGTLGAIAAPVAIGLGVAFLLNKLFD